MNPSLCADGQAGNDGALDHRMRIVQENQVILAGAGLALVAVHQHIFRLGDSLGNERPLHAGRETRAAASAQVEAFISLMIHSGALRKALLRGLVAAQLDVLFDVGRALAKAAA